MTEPASPSPSPSLPTPAAPGPAAPAAASPPTPLSPVTTPSPAAPATVARPDWLPDTFQEPKAFRAAYDELAAFKAGQDVRRSTLPAKPEDYKTEFSPDFKIPDGIKYEFNANDPLLAQARSVMHDIDQGKISGQQAFTKLLELYAGGQVSSQQQITTARNANSGSLALNSYLMPS